MTMLDATTAPMSADARAFVLLKSRRRLDLLNPDPQAGPTMTSPPVFPAPCVGAGLPGGLTPYPSPSTA